MPDFKKDEAELPESSTEETIDETVEETEPAEETEESTEETEEVDESEVSDALSFWRALKDPTRAPGIIESIARRMNLITSETTQKDTKSIAKTLSEEIEEMLPVGYEDIGKALLPAIEKIITARILETEEKVEKRFAIEAAKAVDKEYNSYIRTNKVTDDEANEIAKLSQRYPPNSAIPLNEYLDPLLELVRSRKGSQSKKTETVIKQANNLNRRIPTTRGESNEETMRQRKDAATPGEAVRMALRELQNKKK